MFGVTPPRPPQLRARLATHRRVEASAVPGRRNDRRAGVLVPIVWDPDPVVIVTLRPASLRRHGGEVCFPGGRPEPGDADLWETAVREAREELSIVATERLGRLSSIPLYTSEFRLEPFVARVDASGLRPDPAEVAAVYRLDPRDVFERAELEGIAYEHDGVRALSPLFELTDGTLMFGATAHSYWELLEVMAPLYRATLPGLVESDLSWPDVLGGRAR
ncbi:MAG: hypothetical protein CSA66_04175 [Proteobacteria bacterium]|nr:MAG: hypothetical protein CSA66_04175 [Pseudomonadota bacterium]